MNVLVADDNRDAADTLVAFLELLGHTAAATYDGVSALAAARQRAYDCLVSDIDMPGLDGYELARRVRADPALARVRLVALSAHAGEDHDRAARAAGFEFVFTKPADAAALEGMLAMMERIRELAERTEDLARRNVELAGEARGLLGEVKDEVREIKDEVREVRQEVRELKKDVQDLRDAAGGGE